MMSLGDEEGFHDFVVSRGEYLAGLAVSEILGYEFVDPKV